ncbi:MAG: SDR family NAD(P)-dependent oxidoreductase [Pseudomonadota bacterium]|nr:SDR family NAD(P)-dependent oxidoreductase [Pseudomonadota bacterium]
MQNFLGKTAVITGGGSGIGEALGRKAAALGMAVVLADIDVAAAERVAADLSSKGARVLAVQADVADAASVAALAEAAWERFGSVDLLCNNAGVVPSGRYRPVWEYPLEDWQWSFGVNTMGIVHGLRSFVPRMLEQETEGHILNTASVAGLISGAGSPVYSAAKHAAVRITEALYASLIERKAPIGVTLLCPGLVATAIYESERNRPAALRPAAGIAAETPELQAIADNLYRNALSADAVAEQSFAAIRDNRLYVLTSDQFDAPIRERADAILARRNPGFESLLALSKGDVEAQGRDRSA